MAYDPIPPPQKLDNLELGCLTSTLERALFNIQEDNGHDDPYEPFDPESIEDDDQRFDYITISRLLGLFRNAGYHLSRNAFAGRELHLLIHQP